MKYSTSLSPEQVIEHVVDMEMWHGRVWVNHEKRIYFVPIWRNANTQFMYLAEQFGFTLDLHPDVDNYIGFAFVRHPYNRIAGQYWRAMENNGWTADYVTEQLQSGTVADPHFETQASFLQPYNISYFINLDDPRPVDNALIQSIIKEVNAQKSNRISSLENNSVVDYLISNSELQEHIENYFRDDFDMFLKLFPDTHKLKWN